jgi:DNA-binding MarR family transcriptional regulator
VSADSSSRADALRGIEREVGVLIRRVRRVIRVVAGEVHPDLQPAAYLLLAQVQESGPLRSSVLVDSTGVDKGAVSRQIQQLVDLGLVDRAPDPHDGRATLVSLTDEARSRLERVRGERSERFDRRLAGWTAPELASFAEQLGRYNAALDDREA